MAPLAFDTTLSSAGDALIALSGELDLSGAPALDEEIDRLAADDGVRQVVLDLRGLEFMDSSGLRVVALAEPAARAGGARPRARARRGDRPARVRDHPHGRAADFVDSPEASTASAAATATLRTA